MASRLLQEFKEFAMKGSVVDLAVGIIIGTAFGAIVKSLVDDIVMPVVGVLLGGLDYSTRFYVIKGDPGNATTAEAAREAGASVLAYGRFVNNVLTFLIVAWSVFLLVKAINRMRRRRQKEPPSAAAMTRACPECTTEISKLARRCPSCTAQVTPVADKPAGDPADGKPA
jgi:large conductance mechanosensitive channel